jgi:hypothetical protein
MQNYKGHIRSILYICSWSAVKSNAQCKALYERILEKGKCKTSINGGLQQTSSKSFRNHKIKNKNINQILQNK